MIKSDTKMKKWTSRPHYLNASIVVEKDKAIRNLKAAFSKEKFKITKLLEPLIDKKTGEIIGESKKTFYIFSAGVFSGTIHTNKQHAEIVIATQEINKKNTKKLENIVKQLNPLLAIVYTGKETIQNMKESLELLTLPKLDFVKPFKLRSLGLGKKFGIPYPTIKTQTLPCSEYVSMVLGSEYKDKIKSFTPKKLEYGGYYIDLRGKQI